MNKTITSSERKILNIMVGKFKQKQSEREALFIQKEAYLDMIFNFLVQNKELVAGVSELIESVEKLKELEKRNLLKTQSEYLDEIASLTEVSVSTLKRIKREGAVNAGVWDTPGKKRPHKPKVANLDSFDINAIRNKINEYYIVRKEVPTLRSLFLDLQASIGFTGCRETLRQILLSNGYEFKKNKNERSLLVERYEIGAWRHRYLREVGEKRAAGKQIVYLDKTYVHKNYKPKQSWQGPSTSGAVESITSGKRYIIVHAGHENGFVPNALLVFSTKSKSADYHHDMNSQNFNKWVTEKLIPNLNVPSVIVMDNASYHTVRKNKAPTTANLKAEIKEWLNSNGIHFEDYHTKAELLCLVNKHKPEPVYEADELLNKYGHEVLRLPPYHCELNPIELIWSLAKRKVAKKNINQPAAETEKLIAECFASITAEDWKKMTDHVVHVENKYRERDCITETEMEKFMINVGESETSESEESIQAEFLDSDFDYDL